MTERRGLKVKIQMRVEGKYMANQNLDQAQSYLAQQKVKQSAFAGN